MNICSSIGFFTAYSFRSFSLFSIHKSEQTMVSRRSTPDEQRKRHCLLGPLKPEWTVKLFGTMLIFFLNGCSIRSEVKRWMSDDRHRFRRASLGIVSNTSRVSNSSLHSNLFLRHLSDSIHIFLHDLSSIDVSISNRHWVNSPLFIFVLIVYRSSSSSSLVVSKH